MNPAATQVDCHRVEGEHFPAGKHIGQDGECPFILGAHGLGHSRLPVFLGQDEPVRDLEVEIARGRDDPDLVVGIDPGSVFVVERLNVVEHPVSFPHRVEKGIRNRHPHDPEGVAVLIGRGAESPEALLQALMADGGDGIRPPFLFRDLGEEDGLGVRKARELVHVTAGGDDGVDVPGEPAAEGEFVLRHSFGKPDDFGGPQDPVELLLHGFEP